MVFDEFLFMTGDKRKWMIMDKEEIWGGEFIEETRSVKRSSLSDRTIRPIMRRVNSDSLPTIVLGLNDFDKVATEDGILYAEGWDDPDSVKILTEYAGNDVYVR